MSYSLIDFNYSDFLDAKYENEHLINLKYDSILSPILEVLNLSTPCESVERYKKLCNTLIEFCMGKMCYYANYLDMNIVVHLRLKVRLEVIKSKLEENSSIEDALKPYALKEWKYQDLSLFEERESTVNKITCEQLLTFISKKPDSPVTFQTYSHKATVNWVIAWSKASQHYRSFLLKLLFKELNILYFKPDCMNWLIKTADEELLEQILAQENCLQQLHERNLLDKFLDVLLVKIPDLSTLLLKNVKCLDALAKFYPTLFLSFIKKINSNNFFKLALQRGLEFQFCTDSLRKDFNIYRSEITFALYEALSRGNLPLANDIIEFRDTHEFEQNKVKTVSNTGSDFFGGTISKSSVTTHQQVRKWDGSVDFSLKDLLQYLEEKLIQNKPKEQFLYFVTHRKAFIQSLIKLKLLSEGDVKEFVTLLCETLNTPPFEITTDQSDSKSDPNVLKLIQELQKQVRTLFSENIELKKELKEVKERVEVLEAERGSALSKISTPSSI